MKFASAISTEPDLDAACDAVARDIVRELDGSAIDLCTVFASAHYGSLEKLPAKLMARLRRLFGRTQLEQEEVNILRGVIKTLATPKPKKR